jgi:hypothetical protein
MTAQISQIRIVADGIAKFRATKHTGGCCGGRSCLMFLFIPRLARRLPLGADYEWGRRLV